MGHCIFSPQTTTPLQNDGTLQAIEKHYVFAKTMDKVHNFAVISEGFLMTPVDVWGFIVIVKGNVQYNINQYIVYFYQYFPSNPILTCPEVEKSGPQTTNKTDL